MPPQTDQVFMLGDNVACKLVGTKLLIEIDTKADLGKSSSGKSSMVASTRGNKSFNGLTIGVNAYRS